MAPRDFYNSVHQTYTPSAERGDSLTGEQEQALLENLPVVRRIARRIHERLPSHVELDDLVSAGVIGLMNALVRYDPLKDVKFRTYAQFRIKGAILDSLRDLDWGPRDLRRKARVVEKAISNLTMRFGQSPDENDIAAEVGIGLEEYYQLLGDLKGLEIGSLQVEVAEGNDELITYVPTGPEDDPLFLCLRSELLDRLDLAVSRLPGREGLVLGLYYVEEMTLGEIALVLGVSESRISQIRTSAILHLKAALQTVSNRPVPRKRLEYSSAVAV